MKDEEFRATLATKHRWWWKTEPALVKSLHIDMLRSAWFYEAEKRLIDSAKGKAALSHYRLAKPFPKLSKADRFRVEGFWLSSGSALFEGLFGAVLPFFEPSNSPQVLHPDDPSWDEPDVPLPPIEVDRDDIKARLTLTIDLRYGDKNILREVRTHIIAERKSRGIPAPKAGRKSGGQHGSVPWWEIESWDQKRHIDLPDRKDGTSDEAYDSKVSVIAKGAREMKKRYFGGTSESLLPSVLRKPPASKP